MELAVELQKMVWGLRCGRVMRGTFAVHLARVGIIVVGMTIASCGQAKEPSRPSLLPELATMVPVIACIDAAPRGSTRELNDCVNQAGISSSKLQHDPKTLADFKLAVISTWLLLGNDPHRPLKPEALRRAIDYARCVETAAYADDAFSSRMSKGVTKAQIRAELACKDHPLSIMGASPEEVATAPNLPERLFARSLANMALRYALEANGWFPDEMRPCIRYLDGRPPSAGCAGKPERRPPPPPPMLRHR